MAWTKVTKPTGTAWTKAPKAGSTVQVGTPIGLLLSLTYATPVYTTSWTKSTKPTNTSWTKITKPI